MSLAPWFIGFAFGWILQRTGLSRYDRIANVYRLRDLTVMKVLGSALVTAAIGLEVLRALDVGAAPPIPPTYALGNLLGGIMFGVGMAISGFCPGTVAAGAGEGRLDYLVPGGLGLLAGAVVYGLLYERIMPTLARAAHAITLPSMLHIEPWLAILLFGEVALLSVYGGMRVARSRSRIAAPARGDESWRRALHVVPAGCPRPGPSGSMKK